MFGITKFLHLVPDEEGFAKPFVVGESAWATEQIFLTNNIYVNNGEYGDEALFIAFTNSQYYRFKDLSSIQLHALE